MLDTEVHATLEDLAPAKCVAPSYVSRLLRPTLLAPEIVEATRWSGRTSGPEQANRERKLRPSVDLLSAPNWSEPCASS